jgi:hypothetical protein
MDDQSIMDEWAWESLPNWVAQKLYLLKWMYRIFSPSIQPASESNARSLYVAEDCLCRKSVTVEKEIPLEIDAGFLTVTDLNPVDHESYGCVLC